MPFDVAERLPIFQPRKMAMNRSRITDLLRIANLYALICAYDTTYGLKTMVLACAH